MSWKNIKDHYRIGHIVQVREGKICIGSPYVSDLIKVSCDGDVSWGTLGPSNSDDLARYHTEMTADLAKLRELIAAPDKFEASLPVFTYDGGDIIEKQCEQYDWPNVTHDGFLMYGNSFSADRSKVIEWAKRNAASGVELAERRIEEIRKNLAEVEALRAESAADLAKLESASNREGGGGGGSENLPPAEEKYTADRTPGSLHPAGSAIRWVIVGCHGLYTGQWLTRKDAISTHCEEKGHEWARCKRHGDRAVKALVRWPNDGTEPLETAKRRVNEGEP